MNEPESQQTCEQSQLPPKQPAAEHNSAEIKALRRKTLKFIAIFIVSVFAMLTAHEVYKQSRANDWYLFQVSRSTTFLLSYLGHSSRLVGHPRTYRGKEAWVRASLQAWDRGEEAPPAEQFNDVKDQPLTPYEAWIFSAQDERRELKQMKDQYRQWQKAGVMQDPFRQKEVEELLAKIQRLQNRDQGPTVTFVLKPGITSQIADARKELAQTNADKTIPEDQRAQRVEQAKAKIAGLERQRDALKGHVDAPKMMGDLSFTFIVVPDCGAIPSMIIFVAAVLAFPAAWRKRLMGLGLGLAVLYVINVLRLTFLAVLGAWDRGGPIFRFAHEYVWQGIYIIFVVAVWLAWVEFSVRRKNT